jgi:hypothetical protein
MVGLKIGEDGKESRQKGDEKPDLAFTVTASAHITFPEARENSPHIYAETAKISGITQVQRAGL